MSERPRLQATCAECGNAFEATRPNRTICGWECQKARQKRCQQTRVIAPKEVKRRNHGTHNGGRMRITDPGLYLYSRPTEDNEPRDPEQVALDRKLFCRRYSQCVTHAAALGWSGWNCRNCSINEPIGKDQHEHDREGFTMLLKAIAGAKS